MNIKDFIILMQAYLKRFGNREVKFEVGGIQDEWQDNLNEHGDYVKKWIANDKVKLDYFETICNSDEVIIRLTEK